MTSLLVGVDGSEGSRIALRWAAAVAPALGRPLRAVWAWQYPSDAITTVGSMDLPDPKEGDALVQGQLENLLKATLGDDAQRVTPRVERGPATSALLRAASRHTEMAVVGSRGLGGFKGLLLGSVSRQLCEHATCPVTVVPETTPVDPVRLDTIVVGTDGSDHAARAMTLAGELATRVGAELVVANAVGPGDVVHPRDAERHADLDARRQLVDQWCAPLRENGVPHRIAVAEGDARSALLDLARDRSADLLVVGSRGRGPVRKLLLGSVAASLAQHSELPLTIVPHPR